MAASWSVSAKAAGAFWTITVTPIAGGTTIYQCMYPGTPPQGMTVPQYKTMIAAEVQAAVAALLAAQGNPAAVAGLDGQTF
jgi:hypothetical protein